MPSQRRRARGEPHRSGTVLFSSFALEVDRSDSYSGSGSAPPGLRAGSSPHVGASCCPSVSDRKALRNTLAARPHTPGRCVTSTLMTGPHGADAASCGTQHLENPIAETSGLTDGLARHRSWLLCQSAALSPMGEGRSVRRLRPRFAALSPLHRETICTRALVRTAPFPVHIMGFQFF